MIELINKPTNEEIDRYKLEMMDVEWKDGSQTNGNDIGASWLRIMGNKTKIEINKDEILKWIMNRKITINVYFL